VKFDRKFDVMLVLMFELLKNIIRLQCCNSISLTIPINRPLLQCINLDFDVNDDLSLMQTLLLI